MKQKTWIISALMCAMVIMVCLGVLHLLKEMTENNAPSGTVAEESTDHTEPEIDFAEEEETKEDIAETGPEEEESDVPVEREEGYYGWKQELPQIFPSVPEEVPYEPPRLILATDLHYQSAQADDGGAAFQLFVERGDGKVVEYLPELLEAFMDQVIEEHPSALVLSGDITMNGEKINHEELARGLMRVQDAGIPVLIVPGNHDINNPHAAVYFGEEKAEADPVTPEEFYNIYHMYGYDQAISRDDASLSYVYQLDERNRLLMLDTCQYEPKNMVEGQLKVETFQWADEQLKKAKEDGINVLPIGHHNLLAQSRMYTTQCAMNNNGDVIELFQKYELPLYLSGHLHVQRIRKHKAEPGAADDSYGIMEIVTDALSIPPCQYALLEWKRDGSMEYSTKAVDVSAWAARTGSQNPDLLDFEGWSELYIQKLIIDQIRGIVKNLGTDVEHSMAEVYASVYIDYYAGRRIDAKGIRSSKGYRWWERNMPDSYLLKELDAMIDDSDRDNNYMLLPEVNAAAEE